MSARIKMGMIGCGAIAQIQHLPHLRELDEEFEIAGLCDLSPKLMAQGTGMFNLSRQLGGSFGIAITATLLTRFTEQARDALRPHLSMTDPGPRQWLAGVEHLFMREGGTQGEAALLAAVLPNLQPYCPFASSTLEKSFVQSPAAESTAVKVSS